MLSKLFALAVLSGLSASSFSQMNARVKRKGVQPINVIKIAPVSTGQYTIARLSGKWQEISRTNRNNNTGLDFSDTLCLYFSGNNVYTRDGVSMSMRGKAFVDHGNSLTAAADVYTIRSLDTNNLVLDDGDKFVHHLIKKEHYWYESLAPAPAEVKYETPVDISLKNISGNWQVYRRDAKPGYLSSDNYLVKALNITSITDQNNAAGEITFYLDDKLQTLPATFSVVANKLQVVADKHTWLLQAFKTDGNEFIFGDPNLLYFSKPI